jgi:hypothetical protein
VLQTYGASLPTLGSLVVEAYKAQKAFSVSLEIAEFVVLADSMTQV